MPAFKHFPTLEVVFCFSNNVENRILTWVGFYGINEGKVEQLSIVWNPFDLVKPRRKGIKGAKVEEKLRLCREK